MAGQHLLAKSDVQQTGAVPVHSKEEVRREHLSELSGQHEPRLPEKGEQMQAWERGMKRRRWRIFMGNSEAARDEEGRGARGEGRAN